MPDPEVKTPNPDPDVRESTIVVLIPYDFDLFNLDIEDKNVLESDYIQTIKNLREDGANVVQIGDGKTPLDLKDVERQLKAIEGAAFLIVDAHGRDQGRNDHQLDGFKRPDDPYSTAISSEFNGVSYASVDVSAVFKIVPDNFHTVLSTACFGGDGNNDAVEHLPEGTIYFSMTSGDFPSWTDGYAQENFSKYIWEGSKSVSNAEFVYSLMQTLRNPVKINNDFSDESFNDGERFCDHMTQNFPTRFAVGGRGVFDLDEVLKNIIFQDISEADLVKFAEKYDKLVHVDVLNDPSADYLGRRRGMLNREEVMQKLCDGIDAVAQNNLTWDHPAYVAMYAFAFDRLQQSGAFERAPAEPATTHDTKISFTNGFSSN